MKLFGRRSAAQAILDAANADLVKAQRRRIALLEEENGLLRDDLRHREEMLVHYIGEVHECELWNALMESPFTQHRSN